MAETLVSFDALTVRYGSRVALDNASGAFGRGATGLLGPNGAGKTTLLKSLLGFLKPTSGKLEAFGFSPVVAPLEVRRRIGYMPEVDAYLPDLTAVQTVAFAGELSGLPQSEAIRRAHEVLHFVGLGEERYRKVETYSTGMKQRAKLAQALAHDPRLVLLDEPTNGLDPAARDDMLHLISRIGRDFGIAVVVTSHLLGELERVSDHVVVLDAGRLLRASATDEFLGSTGLLLVEVLGGVDAQNALGQALANAGLPCRPRGRLVEIDLDAVPESPVHDLVRDTAADLGLGLVRIQADHRRIEDVFNEGGAHVGHTA